MVSITSEFNFVKIVFLLTLNKSRKKLVILLTLNKSRKSWLFCYFEQIKKMLVILLTLNNTVRPPLVTLPSLCGTCVTYRMRCHAIGHQLLPTHSFTASATDLRERFLLSSVFHPTLLRACFKASLGAGNSASKLAGLHADLRSIAPAQLFVWITAIHKIFIRVGSI